MAIIEKFLGKQVKIPEDRMYAPASGLWGKTALPGIVFGLTEPALVLAGGANSLDWLVDDGQFVHNGEAVVCMITAKILFIETPVDGVISFNQAVKQAPSRIAEDPYGDGWMFTVTPEENPLSGGTSLSDWSAYLECLNQTDGFKNPEGVTGGVSGICKAVYSGIREQKI